jgi:uncharacterized protein YhbP (UPF0306 family)
MSRSDWRKFFETRGGLILSIFVAALAAVLVTTQAILDHAEVSRDAAARAANYAENAQNNIPIKCSRFAGQAAVDCADEIKETARANQRAEYDVAAQETMAIWTAVMGTVAVLGVALSGVGVYLIWQTWAETRKAAESGRASLDAFIAAERPILRIRELNVNEVYDRTTKDYNLTFWIKGENIGKGIATINGIKWDYSERHIFPDAFAYSKSLHFFMPPTVGEPVFICRIEELPKPETNCFVMLQISYGGMGKEYTVKECYWLNWRRADNEDARAGWRANIQRPINMPKNT